MVPWGVGEGVALVAPRARPGRERTGVREEGGGRGVALACANLRWGEEILCEY